MTGTAIIRFDGSVVLVTGGTRGIGRGVAEAFLDAGAQVIVCGRNAPEQPVSSGERQAVFMRCDVRDAAAVSTLVDAIAARYGHIDVLINNAGGAPQSDAATSSPRLVEKIVQLNLLAPFYCSQAANRHMQSQDRGGSIINISSICALRPSRGTAMYGAAKAGLVSLTQGLALEWGPKVCVNALIVGLAATEEAMSHYGGPGGAEQIGATLPLRRMALPQDIAAASLYLASPLAAYVSGAQLAIHGGGELPLFERLIRSDHAPEAK